MAATRQIESSLRGMTRQAGAVLRVSPNSRALVAISCLVMLASFASLTDPALSQSSDDAPQPVPANGGKMTLEAMIESVRKLIEQREFAEAERRASALVGQTEERYGSDAIETARALDLLVESMIETGKALDPQCLDFANRAVRIKESAGVDELERAVSLVARGHLLREHARLTGARHDLELAVALQEEGLRKNPSAREMLTADAVSELAGLYVDMGFYPDARAMFERQLSTQIERLGPKHRDLVALQYNLARLLVRMGEFAAAEQIYRQAIAVTEESEGHGGIYLAYLLNGLAILNDERGDYIRAQEFYELAMARAESADPDRPIIASILNNIGHLHENLGDYGRARGFYERALEFHVRVRGPDSPYVASTMLNLADLDALEARYEEAEKLYNRALNVWQRSLGPEHPSVATCLLHQAELCSSTGDLAAARALCERALRIREKTFGRAHVDTWSALAGLAGITQKDGDLQTARQLSEEALDVAESALGPDNPRCARALHDLAVLHARTHSMAVAESLSLRAECLSRDQARLLASALPERQALRYASVRTGGLDLAIDLVAAGASDAATSRSWDCLIRSRALVLDETAARQRALTFEDPETAALADDYALASKRLAYLLVTGPGASIQDYRERLEEARLSRERAERALAKRSAAFRGQQSEREIGLDEVRAALPGNSALVAYICYERQLDPAEGPQVADPDIASAESTRRQYAAFVLTDSTRKPVLIPLGSAREIDGMIASWSTQLERPPRAASLPQARATLRILGAALRRKIWDPIAERLAHARVVFIVPDGALYRVAFAALPLDNDAYLIDSGIRIHYLSAERDLVANHAEGRAGRGALVLGGAHFDARPSETLNPSMVADTTATPADVGTGLHRLPRFKPLPGTIAEADTIARLWRRAAVDEDVVLLTGGGASESAVKRLAPGKRMLHLATHGFFLGRGQDPLSAAGSRGVGGFTTAPDAPAASVGVGPLGLSGLALSGANLGSAQDDGEDGVLTAEEIAAMDLSGIDWAVLSACMSGTGDVQMNEGILGLRRAFRIAGAKTLIMSLWSIEDEAAREWMEELYRSRLQDGLTTVESVHRATLTLLERQRARPTGEHPFYWAGFVAAGEWR